MHGTLILGIIGQYWQEGPWNWSNRLGFICCWGFLGGSDGKESACKLGDSGSILGSGRSPVGGNGYLLQDSCPEKPMGRGNQWATVHSVAKILTRLSNWHFPFHFFSFTVITQQSEWESLFGQMVLVSLETTLKCCNWKVKLLQIKAKWLKIFHSSIYVDPHAFGN